MMITIYVKILVIITKKHRHNDIYLFSVHVKIYSPSKLVTKITYFFPT